MYNYLLENYLSEMGQISKAISGQKVTPKKIRELKKKYLAFNNEAKYKVNYEVENNQVLYHVVYTKSKKEKRLDIQFLYVHKKIKYEEFKTKFMRLLDDQISLVMCQQRARNIETIALMKKLGFQVKGMFLVGGVQKALKSLKPQSFGNLKTSKVFEEKELKIIAKNDWLSNVNEKRSIAHDFAKKHPRKFVSGGIRKWEFEKLLAIKEGEAFPGHISFHVKDSVAHISSISVLPEYRGKGLSKELYRVALEEMKKKNVKRFTGLSSTPAVLNLGKAMGRQPYCFLFELKR